MQNEESSSTHRHGLITKIEQQKQQKHRFNIYINDEYAFSVHEDVLVKFRLMKGRMVDTGDIETISAEEEFQKAYHKALLYLARKLRSTQSMRVHLESKGFEAGIIDQVIGRLLDEKLLDDHLYAEQLVRHRIMHQKKGKRWVQQELSQSGIDSEAVAAAMNHIDTEAEFEIASQLAAKKWRSLRGDLKGKKQKTVMYLARRGYGYDLIHSILSQLASMPEDELEE